MKRYYYKKKAAKKRSFKQIKKSIHICGVFLSTIGIGMLIYFTIPLMVWKVFFLPSLTTVISPLPESFIFTLQKATASKAIKKVLSVKDTVPIQPTNTPSENKEEWILSYPFKNTEPQATEFYTLSIPKLGITNATVATQDTDLSKHLVQYYGTPIPPHKGNTVIFGHSTLPQLFDPNNYTAIFATLHTLKEGDSFFVSVGKKQYTYKIIHIIITTPDNISVLEQDTSDSYITMITCTPPGTLWKRLIIKAVLVE